MWCKSWESNLSLGWRLKESHNWPIRFKGECYEEVSYESL